MMSFIYIIADEPRATVARLKSRYSIRDPSVIYGNYRLQNNRVNTNEYYYRSLSYFLGINCSKTYYSTSYTYD